MFAPPPLPLPQHRTAPTSRADSALYALSASEALTSLLSSLPPLPVVHGEDSSPLSARCASDESLPACKVEELSEEDVDGAVAPARQPSKGARPDSSSLKGRPQSSGAYSQASQSTASSFHSFVSALSPTPPNLPARSGPLTLQLATALQPPSSQSSHAGNSLPPPPPQRAAAANLSSLLDPHLLHLLYLYSSRSLSPFNEHSIWSCFLSHLQQPDPANPDHRLPLCDKRYQRSSRRSFKNHVWKCLCRHFPSIAKFTYSEFRRLCATDRTVMAGFHAVTLFPRPQKKRRSTAELSDGERWLCPHGCGQEYRNTSSTSIGRHLRKECRLKDMNEEEKQEERRTLKQHEKDVAAYQALRAVSTATEVNTQQHAAARLESVGTADLQLLQHNKRVRLSSTEPIATTITAPLLRLSSSPTAMTVSATANTVVPKLPPVPTFSSSSTIVPVDAHQMPLLPTMPLPISSADTTAGGVVPQLGVGGGEAANGRGVRVMSTAEIALLEAQLMDTMHTQLVIDRLLADLTARSAVAAANNNNISGGQGGGPVAPMNSAGDAVAADGHSDWQRGGNAIHSNELIVPSSQPEVQAGASLSPPHFVSMSNAPSPFPPNPRQLQRVSDASVSRRLAAIQAAAASMTSPPLSNHSPLPVSRSVPPVRPSASSTSSPSASSGAPPPYPLLTSDEAVAVIRQQLSLQCVTFLSQPGRDIRQLPSALLQVVAGLPVAVGSTMVQDTLRALALHPSTHETNGRTAGALAALQRNGEHGSSGGSGSGNGNTTTAGSNGSTPVPSPFGNGNDYQPSPSAHSASSGSSTSYKAYCASSASTSSMPLFPSAASILLSPLSLFDPHRLLTTPPLDTAPAQSSFQSSFSSPANYPLGGSLGQSPSLSALLLPPMSSSPPPHMRAMSANLAQLYDRLNTLPSSTASLYRQQLQVGDQRDGDDVNAAASLLHSHSLSHSHLHSHSHSHAAAVAHASAAAAGQQKLLQLATPRSGPATNSSRIGHTSAL